MLILRKISINQRIFVKLRQHSTCQQQPKPFAAIPGPVSIPIFGTLYLYLPVLGRYRLDRLHKNALKNYNRYGAIIREEIVPGQNIIWLAEPDDIAKMFQNEGPYPLRKSHLTLEKYRLDRPHIYNSGGLLPTNGAEWARIRKIFQKGLSSPVEALNFIKDVDEVVTEWLDTRIEDIQGKNMDYLHELSRLYLELIGVAAFDIRLQSFSELELLPNSKSSKLLDSAFITNSNILKGDNGPQLWRKIETPTFRKLRKAQEFMESVAIDLVAWKISTFKESSAGPPTLLERYISSSALDFKDIVGIACDFLLAGMDTTTYATSFLLYHLGKNPEIQEKLYKESLTLLPTPDSRVQSQVYKNAKYAKCCLKESLRLNPISIGVGRVLPDDIIFSGYHVPKGTLVVTLNQIICRMEKYFKNAETFLPERWLKGDQSYAQSHPYIGLAFGHGQRSCIARRLAEQNMTITILKLIRRYEIEWQGGELDCQSLLINKPDAPILLSLRKR